MALELDDVFALQDELTETIVGVTLAVFLIGLLTFGLSLINVPGIVLNIYVGLMLIGAIALPKAIAVHRRLLRS